MIRIHRHVIRSLVAGFAALLFAAPALAEAPPVRVGMSTALTGPMGEIGREVRDGITAYFETVNSQGGLRGRRLELAVLDDRYEPARTGPNVRRLIDEEGVMAILGNFGTPSAVVTVPIVNEKHVPLVGAVTGADLLRPKTPHRWVVNFRASYAQEMTEIVRGLVDDLHIPPENLAFVTQDDAYGDAGYQSAVAALEARGFAKAKLLPRGRYQRNTEDVEGALARLIDPRNRVRAVVMVGTAKPCAKFMKLARAHGLNAVFATVSTVGSQLLARELAHQSEGFVVTQVVPHWLDPMPITDLYRQSGLAPSHLSLEGFIVARAFVEIMSASTEDSSRDALIDAAESGRPIDLGLGAPLTLSRTRHQLSDRVWLTRIRSGRVEPLASWSEVKRP